MPGLFSWVSRMLTFKSLASKPAPLPVSPHPQVQNRPPAAVEPDDAAKLNDRLFCWLLDATPAQLDKAHPDTPELISQLSQKIRDGRLDELPRQPMTLPKVLRALSDPDGDRGKLTKIILDDPAMTDQLLQVANSPLFRPGEQDIESVDQAIFVLGMSGIRNVISAAIMRPMLSARNNSEAAFANRVWRWGLTCARAAELIAKEQNEDASAYFMVGLLPALSYLTLHRELHHIMPRHPDDHKVTPAMIRGILDTLVWPMAQQLGVEWNLPSRYCAYLNDARQSLSKSTHTPLSDGIILGTREALRHAHQRNMPEENLAAMLSLSEAQFIKVRSAISAMLKHGS